MEIDEAGGRIYTDVELKELMKGENRIKFKVGDRVRCTKGKHKGKTGTIVGVDSPHPFSSSSN